jgi:hypothetical protein
LSLAATGFEVTVRELGTLRPHEETIPAHVEQMARRLEEDGVQKDPIVVDRKTGAVLDGMHRLAAFAELGMQRAVCCAVDYGSDKVAVGRWARVYAAGGGRDFAKIFGGEGFTKAIAADGGAEAMAREAGVTAAFGGKVFAKENESSLAEAFATVQRIDAVSEMAGWKRTFLPEDEVARELSREGIAVLLVQKFGKQDVVNAAVGGRLFPCKTSMHIVDPRPVGIGFPLDELRGTRTELLRRILSERRERLLPAGSSYEGRRYKERLLLLNPP